MKIGSERHGRQSCGLNPVIFQFGLLEKDFFSHERRRLLVHRSGWVQFEKNARFHSNYIHVEHQSNRPF